jgi:hypothetical protein
VTRKIAALAALVVLAAILVTACGGGDSDSHARSLYKAYRAAEDARTDAEEELRLAFADISQAAASEDRDAVLAAAQRGQEAVAKIDALIAAELEAARGLASIDKVSSDAEQLTEGLQQSRESLTLVGKELEIAHDDPFLATRRDEVDDLAKQSSRLGVRGELAIRRADHAIATALGLPTRPDQLFTTTG